MKSSDLGKILCTVDMSDNTPSLLQWANLFLSDRTRPLGIEIFHALWIEVPPYFTSSQVSDLASNIRGQKAGVEQELHQLARSHVSPQARYTVNVVEGDSISAIDNRLSQGGIELVVMGTHGRSGATRFLLGSVAEHVLKTAQPPVLIVPTRAAAAQARIKHILCPINFTDGSVTTMDLCSQLAKQFNARLSVMHAVEDESDVRSVESKLCSWIPSDVRSRCEVTEVVRKGSAAEQIVRTGTELTADLIVLRAEHRPFLEFTTIGTTTERVIRHSPCAVHVIPTKA